MGQYLEQGSSFLNGQIMGITIKTFIPVVKVGMNFHEAHLKLWSKNKSNYLPPHLRVRAWEREVWDHNFHTSIHFHPILFHIRNWMAQEQFFKSSKWPLIIHPPRDPIKNGKTERSSLLHPHCNTSQLYVYNLQSLGTHPHHKILPEAAPRSRGNSTGDLSCWGSGIFTVATKIFKRETNCLSLITTQYELAPNLFFLNTQTIISNKSICFLSPLPFCIFHYTSTKQYCTTTSSWS